MDGKKERKARKPNFSVAECNLLLQLAEENLETIREKFYNNLTNKKKKAIWESISEQKYVKNGEQCVGWHGKNSTRKRSLKKGLGVESHRHHPMPPRREFLSCLGTSLDFLGLKAVLSQVRQVSVKFIRSNYSYTTKYLFTL